MGANVITEKRSTKQVKLRRLQARYVDALPEKVSDLQSLWDRLQLSGDQEVLKTLSRSAHNLAGSAGTFGFPALGESARELEKILVQLQVDYSLQDCNKEAITHALSVIDQLARSTPKPELQDSAGSRKAGDNSSIVDSQLVYVIEDDHLVSEEIKTQLSHFGYNVHVFQDSSSALDAIKHKPPRAMIIDLNLPEGELAGPAFIKESATDLDVGTPIVFISNRDDWGARLAAVRAGGDAYLRKPIDYASLLDQLDQLISTQQFEPYRILIVDDMPLLAEHYALVLREQGMLVEVLTDPSGLFDTLKEFNAELIMMDIYMPGCTGLEAAKIIRQKDELAGMPIVFLSTESDSVQQLAAMKTGADDFLQKPVTDYQLINSVSLRVERFRKLRSLMYHDSLTGLLNHVAIKLRLKTEQALAIRQSRPLVFTMIDIDHFKSINDKYGHQAGDRVIKSLSRLLQQRLRKSDMIGRYGGEEFAVILPDAEISDARAFLDSLRQQFAGIVHQHDGQQFSCTFSAGMATSMDGSDENELIRAADSALYRAKKAGRNRIEYKE